VGKDRVQRLMHTHGIKARSKRKFVVTTESKHKRQRPATPQTCVVSEGRVDSIQI